MRVIPHAEAHPYGMKADRVPQDKLADAYKLDQALLNAESRPVAELQKHIETMDLSVDKPRLKVLLSAFGAGAGQILMHDLQRRGFLDFVTRHQGDPALRVGQCVNLLPRDDEEASKVAAQALCKKAGQDVGGDVWKTQAVRAMKASFVKRGMIPSMESPIPEDAPSWVQDFDEMARIEEVKPSIEQMMSVCLKDYKEDWTYEEASIICFCGSECNYDRVLIEAVREGRAQEYGALLHKLCRVLTSKRPFEKVCDFPVFVECDLRAQVQLERGIITDVKQVAEITAKSDTQTPSVSEKTVYSVRLPCGSTDGASTEVEVREGITGSRLELCVNLDKVKATQARDWLQALAERVGPDPGGQVWKQEWTRAIRDKWLLDGFLDKTGGAEAVQARFEAKLQEEKWVCYRSFEAWCADEASGASKMIQALAKDRAEIQVPEGCSGGETLVVPQSMARKGKKFLATLPTPCKPGETVTVEEEDGWTVDEAGVVTFCNNWADVLARSVRDSRPDYAGLLHKSYRVLASRAKAQPPAVDTYRPLRDRLHSTGLVDFEPEWADVVARGRSFFMELQQQAIERAKEEADATGETEIELTLKPSGGSTLARFTSAGATVCMKGTCRDIVPRGFNFMNWQSGQREVVDSPIVRFVSKPRDDIGLHTAVDTDGGLNFVFPPMTLFTVVGGRGPGWELDTTDSLLQIYRNEFDGLTPPTVKDSQGRLCLTRSCIKEWLDRAEFVKTEAQKIWWEEKSDEQKEAWKQGCLTAEYLPEGTDCSIYGVKQPLVIVEATYVLPLASTSSGGGSVGGGGGGGDGGGATVGADTSTLTTTTTDADMWNVLFGYGLWDAKLCASAMALTYHNREAYIRGVDELVFLPPLTMEEEWLRDDKWEDWSKRKFSGAEEWRYVTSGAAVEEDTPVGKHEHGHAGWTLGRFAAHINDTIRAVTGGRAEPLTRDEVIACRLYTGPAYQQLNNYFLRQVGGVEDRQWRLRLAQVPSFSYASTITHLLSAVRKLSFVSSLSIGTGTDGADSGGEGAGNKELLLYRGVSGKLADAFFVPDAQGMITCVDTGFMSTSSGRETPIHYIRGGIGVLFVLHCSATGGGAASITGAHHTGAVLQAVSQYPLEVETLFPPLTMLNVMKDGEGQFMIEDVSAQSSGDGGGTVLLKEIHVVPSFV